MCPRKSTEMCPRFLSRDLIFGGRNWTIFGGKNRSFFGDQNEAPKNRPEIVPQIVCADQGKPKTRLQKCLTLRPKMGSPFARACFHGALSTRPLGKPADVGCGCKWQVLRARRIRALHVLGAARWKRKCDDTLAFIAE